MPSGKRRKDIRCQLTNVKKDCVRTDTRASKNCSPQYLEKNKNKLFACSPMRIAFGLFLFFITLMPGLTMPYDLFMQTNISEKNNHLRLFTI